jgi:hypothetical protein
MFCSKCAAQLPDDANFCFKCASPASANFTTSNARRVEPVGKSKPKKVSPVESFFKGILISIFILLVAGLVILGFMSAAGMFDNPTSFNSVTSQNTSAPMSAPVQPQTMPIVNDAFNLDAAANVAYPFTLDESRHVSGTFAAAGGRKDVECFIMNDFELPNYRNGNQYKAFYESGDVTNGRISVNLSAGNYVLVFNNRAWFDNKTVKANVNVE